ncbi:exodeoxyribonuclease I [Salinisphaera hydrothermalis]|uniref:Exodeoxyribonuclease I n=1 Tax=Salinisphaera hydrothermalis (strain C41B8) TaxID=1304275 RepID=A0A084IPC1_SALHC|nr:exodeoxyribonuclease I [Salinisphaera hydrothermalis]KEZ78555.1 exonuclease I [Salinisphaera hydrothermalis C41B8]
MAEPTFFWHDYETFGADPKRDKPAQFAGIRTDADFNVIGEPIVLYCQPPLDMLGHPEATLITGITPQYALKHGVPEPEFIETIVAEMAKPGTCSVGYNSLQFDDEVTRHTLWRNFFDPYAREWQNGCSRWDIINMVRLTYALRPEGITWPTREDGAPSFRLDQLAPANNLAQDRAHDALSDVHATIGLAKLIRDKQPRLYDYVINNRDKHSARKLLDMDTRKPALHVSSKFPAENGCLSPVMPIAQHPSNKNCIIVYDLRVDPAPLLELAPDEIYERIFTPAEDLPDDTPRIALKGVHLNKCPVLAPFEMMRENEAARLHLDINQCRRNWKAIHDQLTEVEAKATAVFDARVFDAESDAEAALYDGFISDSDRKLAESVRATAPAELADGAIVFSDNRLNELLFRYRARHFPDSLADAERDDWNNWVAKRLEFAPDGGLTLDEYDEVVAALMERVQGDPARLQLLLDLKAWGDKLRQSI